MRICKYMVLAVVVFGGLASAQIPALRTVGQGWDYDTIQDAIDDCNNGDTVKVYPGTYTENIDFLGKRIKVQASGTPAGRFVIDGGQNGSTVTMDSGEVNLTHLDGFTITNGDGTLHLYGSTYKVMGGGIFCDDSSPTIKNCVIEDNSASMGGGIYAGYTSWFLVGPEPVSPIIKDNEFFDNYGSDGGAAYFDAFDGDAEISGNVVHGNTSIGFGAGFCVHWPYDGLVIDSNHFYDNVAGTSSYVYSNGCATLHIQHSLDEDPDVYVTNNIITGSEGYYSYQGIGVGFFGNIGRGLLINNTMADNEGYGLHCYSELEHDCIVYACNNILTGNNGEDEEVWLKNEEVNFTIEYSNIEEGGWDGIYKENSAQCSYGYIFTHAPGFVGSGDYHLSSTSDNLDEGDNTPAYGDLPDYDFDGDNRIINSTVDIGADEYSD